MNDHIDELFGRLAAMPTDRSLEGFELEIGRDIARRRAEARAANALTPIRLASVGLAMAMGVTAGGLSATAAVGAPASGSAFSVTASLAPSTLLSGHS